MKKRILAVLLLLALAVGLLAGCGSQTQNTPKDDPETAAPDAAQYGAEQDDGKSMEEYLAGLSELTFGPNNWPVNPGLDYSLSRNKRFDGLEFTRVLDVTGKELPEGMTEDENTNTWTFASNCGLKAKTLWSASGDAYYQKLAQAVTTGDIPDLLRLTDLKQYYYLVESDLLADLTDELMNGDHPTLQAMYKNADLSSLMVDGRIYAIPVIQADYDNTPLVWIRKDWMEKLELTEPKSYEDLGEIARAFMTMDPDGNGVDDTYGIPAYDNWGVRGAGEGTLSNLFVNVGGAAPNSWQVQEDGTVINGSIMDGAKEALTLLNSWYEEGILPSDFAAWDFDMLNQTITNGKAGICLSPWWGIWSCLGNVLTLDPNAEWCAYALPGKAGDPIKAVTANAFTSFYVVRKDFEDPSAFVYAYDMWNDASGALAIYDTENTYKNYTEIDMTYSVMAGSVSSSLYVDTVKAVMDNKYNNSNPKTRDELVDYISSEIVGGLCYWVVDGTLTGLSVYDAIQAGQNPREAAAEGYDALSTYQNYCQWVVGPMALGHDLQPVRDAFPGTTESMEMYSTYLDKILDDAYLNMVMGKTDGMSISDYFDAMVKEWLEMGGAEITEEVAEALGLK